MSKNPNKLKTQIRERSFSLQLVEFLKIEYCDLFAFANLV